MIKIIKEGQKKFTKTCNRCGCEFQYDLSDLSGSDYINCPCCHTTLVHVGPKAVKIDLSKTNRIDFPTTIPYKIEVGDGRYNYATTTGEYINPNTVTTISVGDIDPKSDSATLTPTSGDPNITIYANKLPDDIVDDPYNKIGSDLPDSVKDNCIYESEKFKEWQEKWKDEFSKLVPCEK